MKKINAYLWQALPDGMCCSHYGNGVRNGAISIAQWGLLSDCFKVNRIGQWGKIVMGFVNTLGQPHFSYLL